jgi:glycosyltransferase involved in cell wall biosynthesis
MRIAMVAHTNLPWTEPYARWFAERGHRVLVVSFHPGPIAGVDTVFVGVEPFDKYRNKSMYATRVPRVRRVLRDFGPDVTFAPYLLSNGLVAAIASPAPVVTAAVGGDVLEHPDHPAWRRAASRLLVRAICARARAIHSVAPHLTLALRAAGVPSDRIFEFPIGIDLERFHPAPVAAAGGEPRIVCTRNHMPVYDIPTILDALARVRADGRAFRATFAGGGLLLDEHRRRAEALGLGGCVDLVGALPHAALPETLRAADVYVSAALSDGTSSALLEALATGLAPVVTDVPANRGWVDPGRTGVLFAPRDADALAMGIVRAIDDAELRARARAEGPARVATHGDFAANTAKLAAVLEAAAARGPLPRFDTQPSRRR